MTGHSADCDNEHENSQNKEDTFQNGFGPEPYACLFLHLDRSAQGSRLAVSAIEMSSDLVGAGNPEVVDQPEFTVTEPLGDRVLFSRQGAERGIVRPDFDVKLALIGSPGSRTRGLQNQLYWRKNGGLFRYY